MTSRIGCRIGGIGVFIGASGIDYRIRPSGSYKKAPTEVEALSFYLVPEVGLEPTRLSATDFESWPLR